MLFYDFARGYRRAAIEEAISSDRSGTNYVAFLVLGDGLLCVFLKTSGSKSAKV